MIVFPRQMIIYFCYVVFNNNYTQQFIADKLSGGNHSKVGHSIKAIDNLISTNNKKKIEFATIKSMLENLYVN